MQQPCNAAGNRDNRSPQLTYGWTVLASPAGRMHRRRMLPLCAAGWRQRHSPLQAVAARPYHCSQLRPAYIAHVALQASVAVVGQAELWFRQRQVGWPSPLHFWHGSAWRIPSLQIYNVSHIAQWGLQRESVWWSCHTAGKTARESIGPWHRFYRKIPPSRPKLCCMCSYREMGQRRPGAPTPQPVTGPTAASVSGPPAPPSQRDLLHFVLRVRCLYRASVKQEVCYLGTQMLHANRTRPARIPCG